MNITELCVNCKQNHSCTMCWKTSNKKCPHFIQKTNADRIRAMSDEELAKQFSHTSICEQKYPKCMVAGEDCTECLLEWLKQPVEDKDEN